MPFPNKNLLSPPIARAAYSDRTAWLMAELSRLAYEKFEGDAALFDDLARKLAPLQDHDRIKKEVATFVKDYMMAKGAGLDTLKAELTAAGFELVATFNNGGTQAFLAKREADRMAVLAFRGTEKEAEDIKADLNARFYTRGGIKVHDGFRQAFSLVEPMIKESIAGLSEYKLYITGHSLGGALALVATRSLSGDNIAACYTFGGPRVGNSEFGDNIKVPIYRLVNAADLVPRVPPTWAVDAIVFLAGWLPVPYLRSLLVRFLENFRGYCHHGDMRYLTASNDDFSDLRLIANPDLVERVRWVVQRLAMNWKAGFSDHSISGYCAKLEAYALKRSGQK